jgi:hypothetical protein
VLNLINYSIKQFQAGHQWLTPRILVTQEAEIEDLSSKPTQVKSWQNPISKIPITKRAGGEAQGEGPEFKPHYTKKNK